MIKRRILQWGALLCAAVIAWLVGQWNFHVKHFAFFVTLLLAMAVILVGFVALTSPKDGSEAATIDDNDDEGDS